MKSALVNQVGSLAKFVLFNLVITFTSVQGTGKLEEKAAHVYRMGEDGTGNHRHPQTTTDE